MEPREEWEDDEYEDDMYSRDYIASPWFGEDDDYPDDEDIEETNEDY